MNRFENMANIQQEIEKNSKKLQEITHVINLIEKSLSKLQNTETMSEIERHAGEIDNLLGEAKRILKE